MTLKYGDKFTPLWPINKRQLAQGAWPQFYIGAYPYCFRLPEYTSDTFPPTADHTMSHGGAGTAEEGAITRPLMMGQAPGTHWYHAHKHGSTAINVANGMTGAFIIEGKYDDDLNDWYGKDWTRTQPVMVINQLGVSTNLMRKSQQIDKGPDFSINGRLRPVVQMKPGEVQMWRLLNTSGRAGTYFAGPPQGFHWMQLAQDGVQFHNDNYQHSLDKPILLASGNRADILIKAPDSCAAPNDCTLMVQNEVDPGDLSSASPVTFLTVNISGNKNDVPPNQRKFIPKAPEPPKFLDDITAADVKGTKKLVFATVGSQGGPTAPGNLNSPPKQTIDGQSFDGEVGAVVLLNTTEEWTVMNTTTNISHPFHIHINPFQVVEVFAPNDTIPGPNGTTIAKYVFQPSQLVKDPKDSKKYLNCLLDAKNPDTWKDCHPPAQPAHRIWWDVFPIPSGIKATDASGKAINDPTTGKQMVIAGYFKMRSRFVDYSGYYVMHCHILAHEDRGMMTIVEVAPARTPYSHN
jgi:FtsP/CotA-like multicopper oxidase with cupredoxin domain